MTTQPTAIYLVISGAGAARYVPNLLEALPRFDLPIYTFMTEAAHLVINPWQLTQQPGHQLVESHFHPILSGGRPPGLALVAPATFNTVNKISQGIADTLAHSLVAEAVGAGWPVIVAPAMNPPLANHPQYKKSAQTLREWGVTVVEPPPGPNAPPMASVETIIETVREQLCGTGATDE